MAKNDLQKYTVQEKLNKMKVDTIALEPGTTTNACSDAEIIFANETLTDAVGVKGGSAIIQSIVLIDDDDHGGAVDLIFHSVSGIFGTEGAAISSTDVTLLRSIKAVVTVSTYMDGVNWMIGHKENIGAIVSAESTSTDLYVTCINRSGGALTYSADGLYLIVNLVQD